MKELFSSYTKYFFAIFLVLMTTLNLAAQGTRGTIRGTVSDPNGAVVTNANVQLIDVKGTTVRSTTTNENGEYQFTEIEPSTYKIIVKAANFIDLTLKDFTVSRIETWY